MENMESMGSMEFTHFDQSGNATMVDVSEKEVTQRLAVAEGRIRMTAECFEKVKSGRIGKVRHIVPAGNGRVWEVDEFLGENAGLIMAEIELGSEDEAFERPFWLGEEVTGDRRYYNSYLSKVPFGTWK